MGNIASLKEPVVLGDDSRLAFVLREYGRGTLSLAELAAIATGTPELHRELLSWWDANWAVAGTPKSDLDTVAVLAPATHDGLYEVVDGVPGAGKLLKDGYGNAYPLRQSVATPQLPAAGKYGAHAAEPAALCLLVVHDTNKLFHVPVALLHGLHQGGRRPQLHLPAYSPASVFTRRLQHAPHPLARQLFSMCGQFAWPVKNAALRRVANVVGPAHALAAARVAEPLAELVLPLTESPWQALYSLVTLSGDATLGDEAEMEARKYLIDDFLEHALVKFALGPSHSLFEHFHSKLPKFLHRARIYSALVMRMANAADDIHRAVVVSALDVLPANVRDDGWKAYVTWLSTNSESVPEVNQLPDFVSFTASSVPQKMTDLLNAPYLMWVDADASLLGVTKELSYVPPQPLKTFRKSAQVVNVFSGDKVRIPLTPIEALVLLKDANQLPGGIPAAPDFSAIGMSALEQTLEQCASPLESVCEAVGTPERLYELAQCVQVLIALLPVCDPNPEACAAQLLEVLSEALFSAPADFVRLSEGPTATAWALRTAREQLRESGSYAERPGSPKKVTLRYEDWVHPKVLATLEKAASQIEKGISALLCAGLLFSATRVALDRPAPRAPPSGAAEWLAAYTDAWRASELGDGVLAAYRLTATYAVLNVEHCGLCVREVPRDGFHSASAVAAAWALGPGVLRPFSKARVNAATAGLLLLEPLIAQAAPGNDEDAGEKEGEARNEIRTLMQSDQDALLGDIAVGFFKTILSGKDPWNFAQRFLSSQEPVTQREAFARFVEDLCRQAPGSRWQMLRFLKRVGESATEWEKQGAVFWARSAP